MHLRISNSHADQACEHSGALDRGCEIKTGCSSIHCCHERIAVKSIRFGSRVHGDLAFLARGVIVNRSLDVVRHGALGTIDVCQISFTKHTQLNYVGHLQRVPGTIEGDSWCLRIALAVHTLFDRRVATLLGSLEGRVDRIQQIVRDDVAAVHIPSHGECSRHLAFDAG